MKTLGGLLLFAALLLAGCGTTKNVAATSYHVTRAGAVGSYKVARAVAVGSYRVASAPVRYATGSRHNEPVMVGTTDAIPSDVTQPGRPVSSQQVTSSPQRRSKLQAESSQGSSRATAQVPRRETTQANTKPSSPGNASYPQTGFPTAKAVPEKPGYVFSPFDSSGRYVDVSGYASGTKVKDPWTDKIFVVP
jgi:hypothetical protein